MSAPRLSIIIPTMNEAGELPGFLAELAGQAGITREVIVADGGSTDDTRAIAAAGGALVVASAAGRGLQMNRGAVAARGEYLLFLHADSRLPDSGLLADAVDALASATGNVGHDAVAGHFRLSFMRARHGNDLAYRYLEGKTALSRPGTINGDQGLLLTRTYFTRLGGFDESLPFLEDQRIAALIHDNGEWLTLPGVLLTSARRFESEGFHRRYLLMGIMMGLHAVGEHAFFEKAPGVYRTQADTGRLLLSPFFGVILDMVRREWRLAGTVKVFYRLGRYIRPNAWQMFYFLDVLAQRLTGRWRHPFLCFHDRVFGPLTSFKLCDAIAGLLCLVGYLGVLAPFFGLMEYTTAKVRE